MATCIDDDSDLVGMAVYKHYQPHRGGKIIAVVHPKSEPITLPGGGLRERYFATVRVKWVDGTETEVTTSGLADLAALVEETRRKLKTHLGTLDKVNRLGGTSDGRQG